MDEALPPEAVAVLELLLRGDDADLLALRAQIPYARVSSHCGCGCATVGLTVTGGVRAPTRPERRPVVAEGTIVTPDGESPGGILVFAERGWLSSLEIYDWTDGPPFAAWPPPDQIEPVR